MKLYELIYTNTVITRFLSYMGFMAGEGEERAMKVKKRTLEMWKREEGSRKE